MIKSADGLVRNEIVENLVPVKIVEQFGTETPEGLLQVHPAAVSFALEGWTVFHGKGSFAVLDFGRELCGGVRIIVRKTVGCSRWRLTFGESLTEACSQIGEKNATNDHSPRDFEALSPNMSDLEFGQTGFRFVRMELLTEEPVVLQSVFAVSHLPVFPREAEIVTSDSRLNQILRTAIYTLKLNFQNGCIWDGIKRDRLVWCGDLHPEILTSLYTFGDNENIKNSLRFLKNSTPTGWINSIPSYSAWWVINLCDYCRITGNREFFEENRDYARSIIARFLACMAEDGTLTFEPQIKLKFFLDWSTRDSEESVFGVQSLLRIMAEKYLLAEENAGCRVLLARLTACLDAQTTRKPVRAFQILAGRQRADDRAMLEAGGAMGFSTFMAYYILTALSRCGSENTLALLKEYYGGMLDMGATTFWEDFDMAWLPGSCPIDRIPENGQTDIHGDFGKYCYKQFRHSLCHGWSSGIVSFVVEHILGLCIEDGGKKVTLRPHPMGLESIEAAIPLQTGLLTVKIEGGRVQLNAPEGTEVDYSQEVLQ